MYKIICKTISWLLVSGLLIFLSAWYTTGNITASFWAAFWACVLKTPVYSAHEGVFEQLWGCFTKVDALLEQTEEFLEREAA